MDVCFLGRPGIDHIWFNTSISKKIRDPMETKTSILATKEDLIGEFGSVKEAIDKWKTDIIKCLFIYMVAQIVTTFGLLLLFLKK
jgi:hypothetical protein